MPARTRTQTHTHTQRERERESDTPITLDNRSCNNIRWCRLQIPKVTRCHPKAIMNTSNYLAILHRAYIAFTVSASKLPEHCCAIAITFKTNRCYSFISKKVITIDIYSKGHQFSWQIIETTWPHKWLRNKWYYDFQLKYNI